MNWDEYFFNIAHEVSRKSKDPSTKFGSVIVKPDRTLVSVGFNGFPRGVIDSDDRYNDRPTKYKFVVHAEMNALMSACKNGISVDGCALYIQAYPCSSCCKLIIQAGIKEIILDGDSEILNNAEFTARWQTDIDTTILMCQEAGVKIRIYKRSQ